MLVLLHGCPSFPAQYSCHVNDVGYMGGYITTAASVLPGCNIRVNVPVSKRLLEAAKWNLTASGEALEDGFEVKWKLSLLDCKICTTSKMIFDWTGSKVRGSFFNKRRKICLGIAAGVVGIIVILPILLIISLRRLRKKKTENDRNAEAAFSRNYKSLAPKRYN